MSVEVKINGEWHKAAGGVSNSNAPIGAIFPYGGSPAPSGYLMCDGSAVSRTDYSALFAVIGTSFGAGDGSTTFNVPDLRESVPVGIGENDTQTIAAHDTYTLGEFKDDQLQSHGHSFRQETGNAPSGVPANSEIVFGAKTGDYNTAAIGKTSVIDARTGTTTHGKQLGVNYIIKAKDVNLSVGGQALADRVETLETEYNSLLDLPEQIEAVEEDVAKLTGVTSGTGIRNTSYVDSADFSAKWYKIGRICTVNLQYNLYQLTPSSVEIITGLPKPICEIACVGEGNDNTNVSGFVIKTNGTVRTHYVGAEGQFMHGTATYITAE